MSDVFPDRFEETWQASEQRLEIGRLNFELAEERARNAELRARLGVDEGLLTEAHSLLRQAEKLVQREQQAAHATMDLLDVVKERADRAENERDEARAALRALLPPFVRDAGRVKGIGEAAAAIAVARALMEGWDNAHV